MFDEALADTLQQLALIVESVGFLLLWLEIFHPEKADIIEARIDDIAQLHTIRNVITALEQLPTPDVLFFAPLSPSKKLLIFALEFIAFCAFLFLTVLVMANSFVLLDYVYKPPEFVFWLIYIVVVFLSLFVGLAASG